MTMAKSDEDSSSTIAAVPTPDARRPVSAHEVRIGRRVCVFDRPSLQKRFFDDREHLKAIGWWYNAA